MQTRRCHVIALCTGLLVALRVPRGAGQGRLQLPLGRSSVWRAGLDTPKNYDDHMLECGGLWYKKKRNNQCGLCGDPMDKARDNEVGGKFDSGVISGSYAPGQRTMLKVLMTSNHGGYMEFKLCPNRWASQECFNKHPVPLADGSGTRYYLPGGLQGVVSVHVRMPDVTCQHCVMQWTYTGSTEWGFDESGHQCEGCGPQYELRNCADIALTSGLSENKVPSEIQRYNQAETGGRDPLGSYYFDPAFQIHSGPAPNSRSPYAPPSPPMGSDPWLNANQPPQGRQPTNQSPYAPPSPRMRSDPWLNANKSPQGRQPTNQSPYAPPFQDNTRRDPWLSNPRALPMNQSPPARKQTPQRIQTPYAPPRHNGNPDPWTNPRTPTANQSPPRRQPMNQSLPRRQPGYRRDPWTNPRSPVMNVSPPRNNNDHRMPYAPPRINNAVDPRLKGGNGHQQQRTQNNRYPYSPQSVQNSLQTPSSRREQGHAPMSNSNSIDKNANQDPWIISRTPEDVSRFSPTNNNYVRGDFGASPVPRIRKITVLQNQTLELPPRLTCVAQGEEASSTEGMDQWCTDNCNLDYCPEHLCSCW